MRGLILVICLLIATACDEKSPAGPSVPLNQQFTLAPGDLASVEGTPVRVQFVGVIGDSRCPADALCIQLGDATVRVRVLDAGRPSDYDLHTGDAGRSAANHGDLKLTLVQLQPYPFSSRPIAPNDYRATLTVTR